MIEHVPELTGLVEEYRDASGLRREGFQPEGAVHTMIYVGDDITWMGHPHLRRLLAREASTLRRQPHLSAEVDEYLRNHTESGPTVTSPTR